MCFHFINSECAHKQAENLFADECIQNEKQFTISLKEVSIYTKQFLHLLN